LISGIFEGGSEDKSQVQQTVNTTSRSPHVSLSRIILSLDSNVSKQHALQHVLNALQVLHARDAVVAALSSHSNIAGFNSAGKSSVHNCYLLCYLFTYYYEVSRNTVTKFFS
jgi:E3 ubiquitin-protein ligase HERC2